MKFAVVVQAPPHSAIADAALGFCEACSVGDHSLCGVFFQGSGVLNCRYSEENRHARRWSKLFNRTGQNALCCAAAAQKFNIDEDRLIQKGSIAGLGLLIEMCLNADRVVTFGSRK